jgi:hypothetical protein
MGLSRLRQGQQAHYPRKESLQKITGFHPTFYSAPYKGPEKTHSSPVAPSPSPRHPYLGLLFLRLPVLSSYIDSCNMKPFAEIPEWLLFPFLKTNLDHFLPNMSGLKTRILELLLT